MRRVVAAGALAGLLLSGCGSGGSDDAEPAAATAAAQGDPAAYDAVLTALGRARVPVAICPVAGGGAYEVIRPPSPELAAGADHLQYTGGRLYELGPCETPADKRTLLRIYNFPDQGARDAAVEANGQRGVRPTATWTFQSTFTLELWQNDPTDTGPVGAAASAAHLAIGALPGVRHPQVGNSR